MSTATVQQTFLAWLRQQTHLATPVGDLAGDVCRDSATRGMRSVARLRQHLRTRGACPEAREALEAAVVLWRAPLPVSGVSVREVISHE